MTRVVLSSEAAKLAHEADIGVKRETHRETT